MAWEWAGYAATTVIGLGGIAGTYVGARSQRKGQLEALYLQRLYARIDTEREERKLAYVRFLSLMGEVDEVSQRHAAAAKGSTPYLETGNTLVELLRKCEVAVNEIVILSDDPVAHIARMVFLTASRHIGESLANQDYSLHTDEFTAMLDILIASMREDLALNPSGERMMATIEPHFLKPPVTTEQRDKLLAKLRKREASASDAEGASTPG